MTITNEQEYEKALSKIEYLMYALEHEPSVRMEIELATIASAIEAYEEKHYPISEPSAEDAAEFRRDQEGVFYCEMCGDLLDKDMKCSFDPFHNLHYQLYKLLEPIVNQIMSIFENVMNVTKK